MNASVEELDAGGPIVRSEADATALGMAFVMEVKPDGSRRFVFAGPRCLSVNGVSGEAAMADAELIFDMILPEHRAAFFAAEAQARAEVRPFDVEVAMRRPDGQVRWHRFASLPRLQPGGTMFWDGLQVDVTGRRQMAEDLVEQRRRLEVAVEATGMGFWEWDIEANEIRWSQHNKLLYGLKPSDPINIARYMELLHPDDVDNVRAAFRNAVEHPDGEYSVEHRVVTPAGEQRWILAHARVATNVDGKAKLVVGTSLDITDRKAADERRALLMGELAHRSKNGIAVIMAIVTQTARGQQTVEGFQELIMSRLRAMASSQDLVTAAGGQPVGLADVIGKALSPFAGGRIDVDPAISEVIIRGEMAVGMGLLLHEMATNAVKYGALSHAAGQVKIAMEQAPEGRAAFSWHEIGGPPVPASTVPGFGTRLLQQVLRPQGGEVKFKFEPQGFWAQAEFPTVR